MLIRKCDRCGEHFDPLDETPVFMVSYETLGEIDSGNKLWVDLELCPDCQRDLRNEFYMRGIIHRFK